MTVSRPLGLFEGYGIEMEYMVVEADTLRVRPAADALLRAAAGRDASEFHDGRIGWSNELVRHVIEFKCAAPEPDLAALPALFQSSIRKAARLLAPMGLRLLPTGMHPFMSPSRETVLWIQDNAEIYAAYDRIFGCKGHGWSNLQSTHINLPFRGDAEFGRLHAAIRLVLPLIPALCASSPVAEGRRQPDADTRLAHYRRNQARIPAIAGALVPEPAFSRRAYRDKILRPAYRAIAPHDPEGLLQHEWLNSRAAIARFERDAIEIRIVDSQECPRAEISVCALIVETVKALAAERWLPLVRQKRFPTAPLSELLVRAICEGGRVAVRSPDYLAHFGLKAPLTGLEVWETLAARLLPARSPWRAHLGVIFRQGNLSERIAGCLEPRPTRARLIEIYRRLSECLHEGRSFDPRRLSA